MLRPLRGSHLLLPDWRLPLSQAVALFHPLDRRPVFALPWEGATMVGTTDLDHRDDLSHEPGIAGAELDYLLQVLRHAFPALALGEADVRSTWAGVRPVVSSGRGIDPSSEPREHLVRDEQGLVTVTGGKLTTFRSTAREALRCAARHVPALNGTQAAEAILAPTPPHTAPRSHHSTWRCANAGWPGSATLPPRCCRPRSPASCRPSPTPASPGPSCDGPAVTRPSCTWTTCCCAAPASGCCLRDGAAELLPRLQPWCSRNSAGPTASGCSNGTATSR